MPDNFGIKSHQTAQVVFHFGHSEANDDQFTDETEKTKRCFLADFVAGGLENFPPVSGQIPLFADFFELFRHSTRALAFGVDDVIRSVFENLLQAVLINGGLLRYLASQDGYYRARAKRLGSLDHVLSNSANPDNDHVVADIERGSFCGLEGSSPRIGHHRQMFERETLAIFYFAQVNTGDRYMAGKTAINAGAVARHFLIRGNGFPVRSYTGSIAGRA